MGLIEDVAEVRAAHRTQCVDALLTLGFDYRKNTDWDWLEANLSGKSTLGVVSLWKLEFPQAKDNGTR